MKQIVINACYGGFSLSPIAEDFLAKLDGKQAYFFRHSYPHRDGPGADFRQLVPITLEEAQKDSAFIQCYSIPNPNDVEDASEYYLYYRDMERDDPRLIDVVNRFGEAAGGLAAHLKIVDIPDDVEWIVEEYDGYEHVAEKHRTWS